MDTVILSGEVGSVSWRLEFRYDGSVDCRMKCVKNGAETPELLNVVLSVFVDVLKKRVPAETPPLENSCVGEGLVGELSLSCKDDGELPESELAECQAAIGAAFAEFLETHPDEANEITGNAILAAHTMDAVWKTRALSQRRPARTLDFPELPKRISWRMAPNHQQMRLDLSTILQDGASRRSVLTACRRMEKNLQLVKDAPAMQNFKVDFDRALDLIYERLGHTRLVSLPDGNEIHFELLSPRRGHWAMLWELWDTSSDKSKIDLLAAKNRRNSRIGTSR